MKRLMLYAVGACAMAALTSMAPAEAMRPAAPPEAQACPAGQQPVGDFGILALECDCTVNRSRLAWQFRSEPIVRGIDDLGPASGRLQPGDIIVSVDGASVLTAEGAERFARVSAGQAAGLTVRRDGRLVDVSITARPLCSGDARSLFSHTPAVAAGPSEGRTPRASAPAVPGSPNTGRPRTGSTVPLPNFPLPRFGFALACAGCGWALNAGDSHPIWESREAPRVHQVEPGGPAARGGIRAGDLLTHVDGLALDTRAGGARFGAVEPGRGVRFTVLRDGRQEQVVVVPEPPVTRGAPAAPQLPRYQGTIGNVSADVRSSAPIRATLSGAGDELVIETGTATVRLRLTGRD